MISFIWELEIRFTIGSELFGGLWNCQTNVVRIVELAEHYEHKAVLDGADQHGRLRIGAFVEETD